MMVSPSGITISDTFKFRKKVKALGVKKLERKREYKALDQHVLVVAIEGYCGDWTAYIGSVPGHNHDVEVQDVLDNGSKLSEELAQFLFPNFRTLRWRP